MTKQLFILQIILLILVTSCQVSESEDRVNPENDTEIPNIDLGMLWEPFNSANSNQCAGNLMNFKDLNNARAEIRLLPNGSSTFCLLQRNSNSTWEKIFEGLLPNFEYRSVGVQSENAASAESGVEQSWWDCSDKLFATFDEQPKNFNFLIVSLRRVWACHGSAGGTYQQGLITLFVDSQEPNGLIRGLPGLEVTNFDEPSGNAYTTQYQFCSGAGLCSSYSMIDGEIKQSDTHVVSVKSINNSLYIHDPTSKFAIIANLESSMFDQRSIPCITAQLCEE